VRGAVFWIFQHWIPLLAALMAPLGLLFYRDSFGALDILATGALSFIGVFLVFSVAIDVLSTPHPRRSAGISSVPFSSALVRC
jgi:hypothetical protein